MKTYDKLWKGIIEDLFEEFLHFFFPDNVHLVDFSKGFEFLDQEFDLLFPETVGKDRRVDKLVKAFLLTGEEAWFLLHIEVQGYYDSSFEERMFTSYYRISDRFGKKIAALAIFTDKQVDFNPNIYARDFWGTKVEYTFPTYKVILQNKESLKQSGNPFAIVILAVIAALEKGNANDEEIKSIKWELARLLYERNYTKKAISKVFGFINYYIHFADKKKYTKFAYEVHNTYQKKNYNMGIREIIMQDLYEEGLEEGIQLGIEKGIEKGMEKGIEKGIEKGLDKKTTSIIKKMLIKHPEWDNELIADLADTSVEKVVEVRASLKKEK